MEEIKKYYGVIYKIVFENGEVYNGQAVDFERRMRQHNNKAKIGGSNLPLYNAMRKHTFTVEIVFYAFDCDSLNNAEIAQIKEDKSNIKRIGHNLTEGGGGSSGYLHSDTSKAKMSKNRKGKSQPHNYVQVVQSSKSGEKTIYATLTQAALTTGVSAASISQCCSGKQKSAGGFLWSYATDVSNLVIPEWVGKERAVMQRSMSGEFIATHTSMTAAEASTTIMISNISQCCRGINKSAGGFLWCFVGKEDELFVPDRIGIARPVAQLNKKTGEVINIYPSATKGAKATKTHCSSIIRCCKDNPKHRSARGYCWRYATSDEISKI